MTRSVDGYADQQVDEAWQMFLSGSGLVSGSTMTIPSSISGCEVRRIESLPLQTNRLWTVELGSSITSINLDSKQIEKLIINAGHLDYCDISSSGSEYDYYYGEDYTKYDNLREIRLPYLTNITHGAFANLRVLEKVAASSRLKHIDYYAFSGCLNLKSFSGYRTLVTIGEGAFSGCESLEEISLKGVQRIDQGAFSNCRGLTELEIPASAHLDEWGTFRGCDGLRKLTIEPRESYEAGMTNLFGCSESSTPYLGITELNTGFIPFGIIEEKVEKLIVPETVTTGGERLFAPKGVKKIELPASLTNAAQLVRGGVEYRVSSYNEKYSHDFNYSLRSKDGTDMLAWSNKSSFWCPAGVGETGAFLKPTKRIGEGAFQNCDKLCSFALDTNVTTIGKAAFKGLENLSCVSFASNLTTIGESAFEDCANLRIVNAFPVTLKTLGKRAFANCTSAEGYTFEGTAPNCAGTAASDVAFAGGPAEAYCNVYYYSKYRTSWTNAIHKAGATGFWQGRFLTELTGTPIKHKVYLAPMVSREVDDLIRAQSLDGADVSVDVAEGTTESDVNDAYLLGISPTVTIEDGVASVSADASFEVTTFDIDHDLGQVTIVVTVSTENGNLPEDFSVNGIFDISVCDALGEDWSPLDIGSKFSTTRQNDKQAVLSAVIDLADHKFFKATVR